MLYSIVAMELMWLLFILITGYGTYSIWADFFRIESRLLKFIMMFFMPLLGVWIVERSINKFIVGTIILLIMLFIIRRTGLREYLRDRRDQGVSDIKIFNKLNALKSAIVVLVFYIMCWINILKVAIGTSNLNN